MKILRLLIAFCFFSLGPTQLTWAINLQDRATIKTKIHCDHCKKCPSCGKKIYDALHEVPGVQSVKINPEKQEISIKFNSKKTNLEALRDKVRATGFEADGRAPVPAAYDQLDGCCKAE